MCPDAKSVGSKLRKEPTVSLSGLEAYAKIYNSKITTTYSFINRDFIDLFLCHALSPGRSDTTFH